MVTTERRVADPVMTLPGRYYYDPAIFEEEQERLFSRVWVCVGRADAIARPGEFFIAQLAHESVIVSRDRDGALHASLNVCRHRGARLCTAERGRAKTFVCRYHAWAYDLHGRLIDAPNMRDDPDFSAEQHGLMPVALLEWEGLIWLNLADEPNSFPEQLGMYFGRFDRYHVGSLGVGGTIVYDVKANWKLLVENFNECSHCPPAHPELSAIVPSFNAGIVTGYLGGGAAFGEGVDSLTPSGKTNRPHFPDLEEPDLHIYYGMTLRPNIFLNLHPDYALTHIMEPLAPDRTRITCHWLFEKETMVRPDFDPSDAMQFWDLVNRQDWEICELCQLGVSSKSFRAGGIYAPHERHIRAHNDWVLERLGHRLPYR